MYRINEIKIKISEDKSVIPKRIEKKIAKELKGAPGGAHVSAWSIVKESIDARDKTDIVFVYTVDFETEPHVKLSLPEVKEEAYTLPKAGEIRLANRPVVCGFGPAGIF